MAWDCSSLSYRIANPSKCGGDPSLGGGPYIPPSLGGVNTSTEQTESNFFGGLLDLINVGGSAASKIIGATKENKAVTNVYYTGGSPTQNNQSGQSNTPRPEKKNKTWLWIAGVVLLIVLAIIIIK